MKRVLIFLSLFLLVQACAAASISIETDGDTQYLTFVSDGGKTVGAYTLQLNYSSDVRVLSLEPEPPYMGASNIVNNEGYAKISGFTIEESPSKRLALIDYTGSGDITVSVIDLYDDDGNAISVTNPGISTPTPTPTESVPTYAADPGYVSPGSSAPTGGSTGTVTSRPTVADASASSPVTTSIPTGKPAEQSTPTITTALESSAPTGQATVQESPETTAQTTSPPTTQKSPMSSLIVLASMGIALILVGYKKIDF